jgi:glycosyltransferase involved in cell wall biosynthesis
VIGTAANLKPWKRIERLLYALVSLADLNARLLIVGDGVDRGRLESITDQLGLRSQVIFAGRQNK